MNDASCHYKQYKCRSYVGGETQTSNSKALLTEPWRPLYIWITKSEQGAYRFLTTAPTDWFWSLGENQYWKPYSGGWVGERQLRSHVNTNTNLREEKRTVHCSRKWGFHIMNKKNEGIRIFFLKKESQSELGTNRAAHRIICNTIPYPKEVKRS